MVDSIIVYLGLATILIGVVSLIRPLRFLRIRSRYAASIVAVCGAAVAVAALAFPVRTKQIATPETRLDEWMPSWQFQEKHVIGVNAPPEKAFAAIRAVRADEILFFRALTAIRRCGQPGPESILDAPEEKPLIEVATQTSFVVLADEPPRELIIGTVVAAPPGAPAGAKLTPELFKERLHPGIALATMNFHVAANPRGGSLVTSETRVYANNPEAARRFAVYWRVIHPGSDIIRRMWLRAVKRRAETQR